jgi:hypothetical protein
VQSADFSADIVKCCVREDGASEYSNRLSGLLGDFFSVDELDTGNDFGNELEAL